MKLTYPLFQSLSFYFSDMAAAAAAGAFKKKFLLSMSSDAGSAIYAMSVWKVFQAVQYVLQQMAF